MWKSKSEEFAKKLGHTDFKATDGCKIPCFHRQAWNNGLKVKHENGDVLTDSHNTLNMWKNYFPQLLTVYNVSNVKHIEVRTAESLVPDPRCLEEEIARAKLKKYRLPGNH
jgi:hypothetical protein